MIQFKPQFSHPSKVVIIESFLNDHEINHLLKETSNLNYERSQLFNDNNHEYNSEIAYRESNIKWIPFENKFMYLYNKCEGMINNENSFSWKFNIKNTIERFQYTEYHGNVKGHYNWHVDLGPGVPSYRKLSLSIQLSDPNEYVGGDLQVFDANVDSPFPYRDVPRKKGSAILFPSFTPHRVTPVTKGVRKSLVWWVGGEPFK